MAARTGHVGRTMDHVDAQRRAWAQCLLDFPTGYPYAKYQGAHWRLVELCELGVTGDADQVRRLVEDVLNWIAEAPEAAVIAAVRSVERPRLHASIPGNAVYACTVLGFGDDPRVTTLVDVLLTAQWPDGGWNCDRHRQAHRSSFHETVTPAIALARYAHTFGRADAREAALRAAELLLQHRLFRVAGDGPVIHPSWTQLHYPPYWHYDILQGLRLLDLLDLLHDQRATDALDIVASQRRPDGGFSAVRWESSNYPAAVDYGPGPTNVMLRERAHHILDVTGRR